MKKVIYTKEELQKVIESFKKDLANDGHPNVTTKSALEVLLNEDNIYDITEIVATLAAKQLEGGI
ncbi:hypothetical protein D3C87_573990 [compost metagenome]